MNYFFHNDIISVILEMGEGNGYFSSLLCNDVCKAEGGGESILSRFAKYNTNWFL